MNSVKIENFIRNERLEYVDFFEIISQNQGLGIGMLFGYVDDSSMALPILSEIFYNYNLDPVLKSFAAVKILNCLMSVTKALNDKQKTEISRLVRDFYAISSNLEVILQNENNSLKEALREAYSSLFYLLIEKFCIHDDVIRIAIAGFRLRSQLSLEANIFELGLESMEKIDNWRATDYRELFGIIYKGCEIVFARDIKPKDILSIYTFNTFYRILVSNQLNPSDLKFVEETLLNSFMNYTDKQKGRLKNAYSDICNKFHQNINIEVIARLEHTYPSSIEHLSKFKRNLGNYRPIAEKKSINEYPNNSEYKGEKYFKKTNDREEDKEIFKEVSNLVKNLVGDVRDCVKKNRQVQTDIIGERLLDLDNRSKPTVFKALSNACYYEYIDENSVTIWVLIIQAVRNIGIFSKDQIATLQEYVDYIRKNAPNRRSNY